MHNLYIAQPEDHKPLFQQTFVTGVILSVCCWLRGEGCWKCRGELSSNDVRLDPADVEVAMVTGVVIGEEGRLVTTCCDGSGGLGDSLLLLVELKYR